MRNFTGLGVFPATSRICTTHVSFAPQQVTPDSGATPPVRLFHSKALSLDISLRASGSYGPSNTLTKTLLTKTLPMNDTTQLKT